MKKSLLTRFLKAIYSGLLSFAISSFAQASLVITPGTPLITSFSPSSGPISTTVTIVGTGFFG